ncbi:MAG: DUF4278 domain-containing protein [Cyanobacteriota bacterium]|nr:DUF4278 domain-containing protein [Cyanobacteriota bacterium]
MAQLRYRGVSYDPARHERLADQPVAHTYRGRTYLAPIRHEAVAPVILEQLRYRGQAYESHRTPRARD